MRPGVLFNDHAYIKFTVKAAIPDFKFCMRWSDKSAAGHHHDVLGEEDFGQEGSINFAWKEGVPESRYHIGCKNALTGEEPPALNTGSVTIPGTSSATFSSVVVTGDAAFTVELSQDKKTATLTGAELDAGESIALWITLEEDTDDSSHFTVSFSSL